MNERHEEKDLFKFLISHSVSEPLLLYFVLFCPFYFKSVHFSIKSNKDIFLMILVLSCILFVSACFQNYVIEHVVIM